MLELYIIDFLIFFTNQKPKNMSLTSFGCSLSNHKAKSFKEVIGTKTWSGGGGSKHENGSQSSKSSYMPPKYLNFSI
jgi:hypothetical protein